MQSTLTAHQHWCRETCQAVREEMEIGKRCQSFLVLPISVSTLTQALLLVPRESCLLRRQPCKHSLHVRAHLRGKPHRVSPLRAAPFAAAIPGDSAIEQVLTTGFSSFL